MQVLIKSASTRQRYLRLSLFKKPQRFGAQCIVVAIDAKTGENKWEIFTHGGRKTTGIDAIEWAVKMADFGAGELVDYQYGCRWNQSGYDIALMRQINDRVNIPTIASGGVGNLQHLADGILKGGADAVLAALNFPFWSAHHSRS